MWFFKHVSIAWKVTCSSYALPTSLNHMLRFRRECLKDMFWLFVVHASLISGAENVSEDSLQLFFIKSPKTAKKPSLAALLRHLKARVIPGHSFGFVHLCWHCVLCHPCDFERVVFRVLVCFALFLNQIGWFDVCCVYTPLGGRVLV